MKRRTIGLSLLMIGLVAGMVGFGSWAVFNDTETGTATVGAGTIDLEIGAGSALPINLPDLKPSVPQYAGPIVLHNAGGNPGVLDLHFKNLVDSQGVASEPECAAEGGTWDATSRQCTGGLNIKDISNWIDVDWCVDPTVNGHDDCTGTSIGKLGEIVSRVFDLGVTVQPGASVELWLSFHLDANAGNEYQGDVSNFDVEFTMHQVTMPPGMPLGTVCVRLEDKDAAWQPILGNELYGSVCYGVDGNGDLQVSVEGHGLTPDKWHQITLNGPGSCTATDDQLASGVQQWPDYDSGFWDGSPPLKQGLCPTGAQGIYNFVYVQSDGSGNISAAVTVDNAGVADPAGGSKVSGAYPTLPSGIYSGVKFIVKEIGGASPPDTSWTPKIMEMDTLNFNLP